ncbi:hypothetical protein M2451_001819 [Dysgonomonas sp. PFB1-18]|uniref:hypothetical protein n=1 Tax=unclassified Dysgonomonas TaxID=2630389 RepID=UPI002475D220|nr:MULTISPECIES: hypothetical protein [unclassified Dysgonomonas]MDH6309248.1 hypothetical protein [Dysgonomonas sp. PF1-14]MDH6338872.1 hypothetical protein [Dysgonomonas sp. PF1-16]MDH6380497.1 hypothetical protein [Dysgonomonas sp. PFB1-18]MDH6397700.1 hypothetical protein [Dysgonomonas sp. PF1-23]
MGAFFTNIQIKVSSGGTESREQVIECVKQINIEKGYKSVDSAEKADKSVIISSANNTSWIAVYDEDVECQSLETLNSLATSLSRKLDTTTLSILVNDSDYVYIGLNKNGATVDTISNLNENMDIDFSNNQPDEWKNLILEDSFSFDELKKAWEEREIFVESFLNSFAKLFDISQQNISEGYNYLLESELIAGTILHFIKEKKEASERKPIPVSLNMLAREGDLNFRSNTTNKVRWIITNFGEASHGIDIMLTGESIENNYIRPKSARIKSFIDHTDLYIYNGSFIETKTQTGEKMFYIRLEEFEIPKGEKPSSEMNRKEQDRIYQLLYNISIAIEIEFEELEKCESNLSFFVSPFLNRQIGTYYESLLVNNAAEMT